MKKFFRLFVVAMSVMLCFSMAACAKFASVEDIKKRGKLIVATDPNFPPFELMEGSTVAGWDIDVAKHFAQVLGVSLEIKTMDFESVLAAPKAGKADIAMAGITNTEKRAKNMDFTKNIFESSQVIIVQNDSAITGPADLAGKKVGSQRGTIGQFLADMDPDYAFDGETALLGAPAESKPFDSGALAVADLLLGRIDAIIIDKNPALEYVKKNSGIKILEQTVYDDAYAFAVAKGNTSLRDFLNETIDKMIADGVMAEITAKWFA